MFVVRWVFGSRGAEQVAEDDAQTSSGDESDGEEGERSEEEATESSDGEDNDQDAEDEEDEEIFLERQLERLRLVVEELRSLPLVPSLPSVSSEPSSSPSSSSSSLSLPPTTNNIKGLTFCSLLLAAASSRVNDKKTADPFGEGNVTPIDDAGRKSAKETKGKPVDDFEDDLMDGFPDDEENASFVSKDSRRSRLLSIPLS